MNAFLKGGRIVEEDLSKKLMCFDVDGVYVELVKWWRWNIKFKKLFYFKCLWNDKHGNWIHLWTNLLEFIYQGKGGKWKQRLKFDLHCLWNNHMHKTWMLIVNFALIVYNLANMENWMQNRILIWIVCSMPKVRLGIKMLIFFISSWMMAKVENET